MMSIVLFSVKPLTVTCAGLSLSLVLIVMFLVVRDRSKRKVTTILLQISLTMAFHPNNCCAHNNAIFLEDNFAPYPFCLPNRGNDDACFDDFDLNLTFDDLLGCNDND